MLNDQLTINTLRKLNSRLASEITELRKENAEILELRKKFAEVEAENIELKAEN
ncbi:3677_t:CDS:1, partial [Diversispora eburnea]